MGSLWLLGLITKIKVNHKVSSMPSATSMAMAYFTLKFDRMVFVFFIEMMLNKKFLILTLVQ